ncbi:MAG TPA: hypothetical protein VJT14_12335, partial [Candidatus Dormibacteraeota bacterium]|nr:hypothetical protein [Candidatus Dormibacteraeota bacterium]
AALALATLTANAGNRATHQVVQQGSLVSLVAAATTVTKTDRDVASAAAKAATGEDGTEAVQKPVVAAKPAPKITVSTDCQNAINNLKALRQADATEDAAERAAAQQPPSGTDKVEDASDRQQWRAALLAARSACIPHPSTACQAAIAALQSLKGNGAEPELTDLRNINWTAELASLRTAIGVVATACGERD